MKNRTNIFRGSQRWLAIIMSLVLIISLFPTMAYAAEQFADVPADESGADQSSETPAVTFPANYAQIVDDGGTISDDIVTVSKTLEGTDIENVFDITLTVSTRNKIEEIYKAQDMAVVIVMDISNTMNDPLSDSSSRYDAALEAANAFIDKFQEEASKAPDVNRKIGYVAFNTNAHMIAALQNCVSEEQATSLKNTISSNTASIINNYVSDDTTRFTNIEAGLKLGYDMLASAQESNKYIIFLSDGFPTTYISSGYSGYNPYMINYTGNTTPGTDGYFYDQVYGKPCLYGTSYSDKGADRADDMAARIKAAGATIFSIGIGLGDQTVDGFYNRANYNPETAEYTVNDVYPGGNYIIGTTADSYKYWLENSIGSGYYYDSSDTEGLKAAYDTIFAQIQALNQESVEASWVVSDPMNSTGLNYIDFISFYDKDGVLTNGSALYGAWEEDAEDTASLKGGNIIDWDLKNSGFSKVTGDDQTETYTYSLKYRVRLANETANFVELQDYETNGKTTLTYQIYNNGVLEDPETIDFPIPVVEGYLCEFEFTKINGYDNQPLEGATFALTHDSECTVCAQIGKSVIIGTQMATSEVAAIAVPEPEDDEDTEDTAVPAEAIAAADEDGRVRFENIPSGHEYILAEVDAAGMYLPSAAQYRVTAAYDQLTITPVSETGATSEAPYNFAENTFVNFAGVDLYAAKELFHAETGAPLAVREGQFTFELLDADKAVLQTRTNNAQGYVDFDTEMLRAIAQTKFYIREVNTGEDGITYDNSVYEVTVTPVLDGNIYNLDIEYKLEGQENPEEAPVFRNTFTDPVNLTVQKVWEHKDNAQDKYPESILVQLLKNGTPYGEPLTLSEDNQWTYTWTGLSGTASWTVQELNTPEGYRSTTAAVNESNVIVITNTYDPYTPPPTTYVAVRKVWDDNDNAALTRPESVKIQLFRNGKAYGNPVELSESTRWAYTWYGLDYLSNWEIEEVDVPAGYISTVSETYTTFIVTNTYSPDVPPPPTDDDTNDDDGNGGDEGTDIDITTEIDEGDVPLADIPEEEVPLADVPETGAEMNIWPFITLFSAVSLMIMVFTNRRKNEE